MTSFASSRRNEGQAWRSEPGAEKPGAGNAAHKERFASMHKAESSRISPSLQVNRTGRVQPSQLRSVSNPKRCSSPAFPSASAVTTRKSSAAQTGFQERDNMLSHFPSCRTAAASATTSTSTSIATPTPTSTSKRASLRSNQSFQDRTQNKLLTEETAKAKGPATPASRDDTLRASYEGGLIHALKRYSFSSVSAQHIPATPARRKSDNRDARSVDTKVAEDVHMQRLDLRGQSIRRLDNGHIELSPKLEFVYLRDNNLSSLNGLEILRCVKVLDLSFNEFKGSGFEPLASCKLLQQLYLAGNEITSMCGLPQMPNLEFLSVAQNKLNSLAMPLQPKLQVLAASNNNISSFQGFPYLPVLEHLRLEENPISDLPHVEVASLIVGSTLKRFNNKDLSIEDKKLAMLYPPHTSLCMREGWEFCNVDEAAESTRRFLVAQWLEKLPPGYILSQAYIDPPSEDDCCSCLFVLEKEEGMSPKADLSLKYQWYIGDKSAVNFTAIEGAENTTYWPRREDVGCCLKVDCTPMLGDVTYSSIFAISSPVAAGTGCPRVLCLRVDGELIEGGWVHAHAEVAWCGGMPGKGIVSWLRRHGSGSPVAIMGAEGPDYQLMLDDVDANLLLMYTPVTEEGIKGESHFATTGAIQAALPRISGVQVLGPIVEGHTIQGTGNYFGGREGFSKFDWLRQDPYTGEFKLVFQGTSSYTLTKEDVGHCMKFAYTPVNSEGIEGDTVSVITSKVAVAPPKASRLKIHGDMREGNTISISAMVIGGEEDASRVQWFKTESRCSDLKELELEPVSSCKIAKDFRIPLSAVGFYLVAKYIPARANGETGDPVLIRSDQTVGMLPPGLTFLSITGEAVEGEMLTASYGYVGGHEGKSAYTWYLHKGDKDVGTSIASTEGRLQYKITKEAIGMLVSFKCTPIRDDGLAGEPRSTMMLDIVRAGLPKLLRLEIKGEPIEGCVVLAEKQYWGGIEGLSNYQWFLTKIDDSHRELKSSTDKSYTIQGSDIGGLICVSCEPARIDGVKGPLATSDSIGPILPGLPSCVSLELSGHAIEGGSLTFQCVYKGGERGACICEWYRKYQNGREEFLSNNERLNLTSADVGCHISVIFTPVRKDGLTGPPSRVTSEAVTNAAPVGRSISIPDCLEGEEIVANTSYYGGVEGSSEYKWFRLPHVFRGATIPHYAVMVADTKAYTPILEDVGMYLLIFWTPIRSDGEKGKPLIACCNNPVAPALPTVSNVCINFSSKALVGSGDYHGGLEGNSKMSWYRDSGEGSLTLIGGATSKTYDIVEEDHLCSLIFGYTPVRKDGATGKMVLSHKSVLILPDIPIPRMVNLAGRSCENEVLTASGVTFEMDADEQVWNKYKKDLRYQWSRSIFPGSLESFENLPLQRASTYKVRSEDVGFHLRCECLMTDVFGRTTTPVSSITCLVSPGVPRMDKLEIDGNGFHTNIYAVRGIYSGGREGRSMIQWFRAVAGRPDLVPILGEVGRMYEANVDDIGCRLVAVYTPIREDGVGGAPVSATIGPIAIEPEVAKEVRQKLDVGAVKFEALRDRDQLPMKVHQGLGSLERRVLDVNKKRFKIVKPGSKTSFPNTEFRGSYVPPFQVEIFQNDQHRLKIIIDSENEVDLIVQTRYVRDVIVLVLRGFAQRFNGQHS